MIGLAGSAQVTTGHSEKATTDDFRVAGCPGVHTAEPRAAIAGRFQDRDRTVVESSGLERFRRGYSPASQFNTYKGTGCGTLALCSDRVLGSVEVEIFNPLHNNSSTAWDATVYPDAGSNSDLS